MTTAITAPAAATGNTRFRTGMTTSLKAFSDSSCLITGRRAFALVSVAATLRVADVRPAFPRPHRPAVLLPFSPSPLHPPSS
jgi:hypothetical protein